MHKRVVGGVGGGVISKGKSREKGKKVKTSWVSWWVIRVVWRDGEGGRKDALSEKRKRELVEERISRRAGSNANARSLLAGRTRRFYKHTNRKKPRKDKIFEFIDRVTFARQIIFNPRSKVKVRVLVLVLVGFALTASNAGVVSSHFRAGRRHLSSEPRFP